MTCRDRKVHACSILEYVVAPLPNLTSCNPIQAEDNGHVLGIVAGCTAQQPTRMRWLKCSCIKHCRQAMQFIL